MAPSALSITILKSDIVHFWLLLHHIFTALLIKMYWVFQTSGLQQWTKHSLLSWSWRSREENSTLSVPCRGRSTVVKSQRAVGCPGRSFFLKCGLGRPHCKGNILAKPNRGKGKIDNGRFSWRGASHLWHMFLHLQLSMFSGNLGRSPDLLLLLNHYDAT